MDSLKKHGATCGILAVALCLYASPADADSGKHEITEEDLTLTKRVILTADEQAWVKAHPKIRVHLMAWPPFKINAQLPPKGITIDYLAPIARQVGLQIEYVEAPWSDALKMVKQRDGIDVMPLLTKLPRRQAYMRFTRNYTSYPIVIFSRKDSMFISELSDLRYAKIVVEQDFAMHYRLQRDLPGTELTVVSTTDQALLALASGRADAYLGNLAVGSYLIQKHGLSNLKVAAPSPYGTHDMAMGVRSDWPVLARILDKGLAAVTHREHFQIRQRWLGVRYEYGLTSAKLWSWILGISGVAGLILLAIFLWNRRLKREVVERRRVERELKESQGLLVEAQRLAHLGNWRFDPTVRRFLCSREMFRILGQDPVPEGLDLAEVRAAIHPDDLHVFDEINQTVQDQNEPFEVEFWIQRQDDTTRYVICRGAPTEGGAGGNHQGFIGTCQDITRRKQREEERLKFEDKLRQTQKLESLGVLAGGIAHDFNNLLQAVMGNTEMILMDLPADATEARESTREVLHAGQRAADLCSQMLAYSGRGNFVMKVVNLQSLVEDMLKMLHVSISKKARLHMDFAEDLPPIKADPTQIHQVVMNLITNASEALGDEVGDIRITASHAHLERIDLAGILYAEDMWPGTFVILEVRDSGSGMDEATMERLFEPFFSTKFAGRGLGMSAVQGIIRSHHGAIKVQSSPDQGSTFTVFLPATAGKPSAAELASIDLPYQMLQTGGVILVVDDEESIRKTAARYLMKQGYTVVTAGGGQEAVEIFREISQVISCVVLDMTMPDMDGLETYRELQRLAPDVPTILISGYSKVELEQRFVSVGALPVEFIQKPFEIQNLVSCIKCAIG